MTGKEFLQKEIALLFKCLFAIWTLLTILELAMPGFVIYYFNLNWLLAIVFVLGFFDLLIIRKN